MSEKKRLMLIDGHALAYRAYHAIPPLTSPTGEPTNAAFGFVNMLLKALADYQPDYVITSFDVGRTFRHEEYEAYKAHRLETPDDLKPQIGRIYELVDALGIPICTMEGYEADDVLGSLSAKAQREGLDTIIVTGDSDVFQLVGEGVRVLVPQRTFGDVALYDVEAIKERYGLLPEQLIDLKALMGDSSDNIPGVAGVGAKTATKLLQEHGSLEAIYAHLDDVTPARFRKALEEGREDAWLSKRLASIVRDLDVPMDLEKSRWGEFDRQRVMDLLRELGFRSLVGRIPQERAEGPVTQLGLFGESEATAATGNGNAPVGDYVTIDSEEALDDLVARLREAKALAVDTETTGTDAMRAELVGISLAIEPGAAYYLPVGHDVRLRPGPQLDLDVVRAKLGPVLADTSLPKVCHNAKYDMMVLSQHGMPLGGPCGDTMLAAWLLEPDGRGIGLKNQAWLRLDLEMTTIDELIGKGRNQLRMDQISVARVAPYACADADVTLRLCEVLERELKERDQWSLYTEIELPLVPVLASMEEHGMVVDRDYLEAMSRRLSQRLAELEADIYREAGHAFNINSPKQLGTVLFEELGLPGGRRTKTGFSTDASVIEGLRDQHPIAELLLEYRQIDKLKSTYLDALPALIHPRTGRVHTSFNQTGTNTGRLSSSDPNLQNIPVRTELGRAVRAAFIAPEGHVLLGCDYSQVELRLLAHLSKDPELMGAFHRNEDVHASTAAAIFGVPLAEVTSDQRAMAKTINFGLMYGMSDYGLAARTALSVPEAREFIDAYFTRFHGVKEYLEGTVERARRDGYVETLLGRRRYFPELRSRSAANNVRAAERAAINMPIQGSAADIIKLAMIVLDRRLREEGLASRMVLQVHDELVLEVPEAELERTQALVVETMESAYSLDVPLKVEAATGKNWMEMK
jgi:DNA polymerase-1